MRTNGVETAMIERPRAPTREDYWKEEASSTLIEAWGDIHMKLNRGNLHRKQWQDVADVVNAHHGTTKRSRRTDVQCKNRIDTLKKKYKSEKSKIRQSGGTLTSDWPFYYRLDSLIGTPATSSSKNSSKRRKKKTYKDELFRKNCLAAFAAAAAKAATAAEESSRSSTEKKKKNNGGDVDVEGVKELARAIGKLGEIYERVEEEKQRQFMELETQRMEFMKSLEFEKMQFYMDTQIQLEKIKRSKRARARAKAKAKTAAGNASEKRTDQLGPKGTKSRVNDRYQNISEEQ